MKNNKVFSNDYSEIVMFWNKAQRILLQITVDITPTTCGTSKAV